MKKNLFLIAALVLGATAAVSTNVSADDATVSKGAGTATLSITPGSFKLVGAPSFSFTTEMNKDLIKSGLSLTAVDAKDATQSLTVSDYVGTDGGWTVTAQLGAFDKAYDKVGSLDIPAGAIDAATEDIKKDTTTTKANLVPAGSAATVASSKTGAGDTVLTYANKDTKLNLKASTKVASSSAPLTWTATQGNATAPKFN
ncbi:WxL domain-containing protein [Dellaglioa carnosa]|uniref:WxL domain-containing protein n=1 Tax=Dellaglioa carnosa TaxID=2995136 RepID=A0ABT4JMB9_9LACO|nr:WxL domain-containing protein [Dellaglioa carnosa]MCZ2491136.1 WxL domain-containing protein [Dellaglioa carnosa]MCZ2494214.1 WxL domain-containing protein [Dellaglioa carnosa]MDK1731370.1 WxL domain-containing protein [Dellaglioa carnosa]